ncbi:Dimerisation domain of Zinc Transporter [Acididesulfobacillus acetoxydans]|uniref:Cation diffusion facilitator transporter n=1 Tax=Acididesulfobacillus acetoxydans TaxID=1561005 RepID=A0A8S0VX89_9FIRM|nr:cation diffusion facilitator family transporter [Acididesulfobacillus acetoxydans]CAA7601703.1 Dimerisation domain of Zinc Transporter [Acididesulfobacillus acetoxydans]CEJ09078.1 Cation diffusion facilitator transporter [Acididesulfobacillus acetoxydans]
MNKTGVATLSVASNGILALGKVFVGLWSGSVSIISEGIHSGIDLLASVIALFAVRESGKPADVRHAYGHGKIENVSGTIEAALIFFAALWIILEAIRKISTGVEVDNYGWGLLIMGGSTVINFIVSSQLMRVAKKTDSIALEADALHLRTDVYTSGGVFLGLVLIKVTGWTWLDPLVAILVALLIIKAAYNLTKESFMPLVDVSLPETEQRVIQGIINRHAQEFVDFHDLRTRKAGAERYIDLHLVVPKYASVARVHDLCDAIEQEIGAALPGASVLIHAEPCTQVDDSCGKCKEMAEDGVCGHCRDKKTCPRAGIRSPESEKVLNND